MIKLLAYIWIILFSALLIGGCKPAQDEMHAERTELVMRKIGHQLLLISGDSSSLVQPVIKKGQKYSIQFSEFLGFNPEDLVSTIDTILSHSLSVESYFVEVLACNSETTVYSYEFTLGNDSNLIPCKTRELPIACYELQITLLDKASSSSALTYFWWLLLLIPIAFVLVVRKQKKHTSNTVMHIGNYRFNKTMLTLELKKSVTELSQKEAELLQLLYKHINTPVKREIILNQVWEDEGDYIGRTLDVFISKLRKKLEGDPNIQLKNVRGIGYKLVIEE